MRTLASAHCTPKHTHTQTHNLSLTHTLTHTQTHITYNKTQVLRHHAFSVNCLTISANVLYTGSGDCTLQAVSLTSAPDSPSDIVTNHQDIKVCCSVLQRVAACCSVLQRVAACRSVLLPVRPCHEPSRYEGVLLCVAVCCSVLQCVAVCCSVLQRVVLCCSVPPRTPQCQRALSMRVSIWLHTYLIPKLTHLVTNHSPQV